MVAVLIVVLAKGATHLSGARQGLNVLQLRENASSVLTLTA